MTPVWVPSAPALLSTEHEVSQFVSGEESLDDWLRRRALRNQASGASRCFVICRGNVVIGYYTLSAGAIGHDVAPKAMRRNMPDPLPILLLGRLAVDGAYHNRGLGQALLRDAMMRAAHVAGSAGVFAILVHALTEPSRQFYVSRGFVASPLQPMTLLMTLQTVREILAEGD